MKLAASLLYIISFFVVGCSNTLECKKRIYISELLLNIDFPCGFKLIDSNLTTTGSIKGNWYNYQEVSMISLFTINTNSDNYISCILTKRDGDYPNLLRKVEVNNENYLNLLRNNKSISILDSHTCDTTLGKNGFRASVIKYISNKYLDTVYYYCLYKPINNYVIIYNINCREAQFRKEAFKIISNSFYENK